MNAHETFHSLRSLWLNRAVAQLAKGANLRQDLRSQMEQFFDLLEQVLITGETSWLESILKIWSTSLTQTDLEDQGASLTGFIKEIFLLTTRLCQESLPPEDAT